MENIEAIKDRFESKFSKSDGCWEWRAGKLNGYGRFYCNGKTRKAHRVAYMLYVGDIPDGILVCHHCDNPGCVNPKHLFLGTPYDNIQDCKNKGRLPDISGQRCGHAKLTDELVLCIIAKHKSGVRGVDLAKEFNVSRASISKIINGKCWAKSIKQYHKRNNLKAGDPDTRHTTQASL